MSFGFSVSDFVTVADLARKLHRDVICVARKAPEELSNLSKELGALSTALATLKEDALNAESPLAKSGPDRVATATSAVQFTGETLQKLEALRDKYGLLDAADRSKTRRLWDRIRFAKDLPDINNLRAKLNYHYNIITLLLVAGANSSLERIEATQKDEAKNFATIIESLEKLSVGHSKINQPRTVPAAPRFSAVEGKGIQYLLSQLFLEKAELQGSWLTIGLDAWLQAGRWWLLRYLSWKASLFSVSLPVATQSYVDLLKAAWIMIDVVKEHPQRDYIMSGTQQLTIRETTEVVASELSHLGQSQQQLPSLEEIAEADLSIFASGNSTSLGLNNATLNTSIRLKANGYIVLFQRVGIWKPTRKRDTVEGLILVLCSKLEKTLHFVVQDQSGWNVVDLDCETLYPSIPYFLFSVEKHTNDYMIPVVKYIGRFSVVEGPRTGSATTDPNIDAFVKEKPFKVEYSFSDKNFSWKNGRFASYADEDGQNHSINEEKVDAQEITLEFSSSRDVLQLYLLLTTLQLYRLHFSCSYDTVDLSLFCDIGCIVAVTVLKWDLKGVVHLLTAHTFASDMMTARYQHIDSAYVSPNYEFLHDIALEVGDSVNLFQSPIQPTEILPSPNGVTKSEVQFNIKTVSKIQPPPLTERSNFNSLNQTYVTSILYDFLLEARAHESNADSDTEADTCARFVGSTRLRGICTTILIAQMASFRLDSQMADELLESLFNNLKDDSGKYSYAVVSLSICIDRMFHKAMKGSEANQSRRKEHLRCFLSGIPNTVKILFNYRGPVLDKDTTKLLELMASRLGADIKFSLHASAANVFFEDRDLTQLSPAYDKEGVFKGITTCSLSSVEGAERILKHHKDLESKGILGVLDLFPASQFQITR